jgi:hypothetical protein
MFMNNSLVLIGGINQYLMAKTGREVLSSYQESLLDCTLPYATSMCVEKVFEQGIINTNGVVIDNFNRYAVMLFTQPVSQSYIARLKELYADFGYNDVIYYALNDPSLINDDREPEFETFSNASFSLSDSANDIACRKHAEYAVWWAGTTGETFKGSDFYKKMRHYLEINSHISTYIVGKFTKALKMKETDDRTKLPEYDEIIINGPEGVEMILTLSSVTGLNFHIPVGPEFVKYREAFISTYILYCKNMQKMAEEAGASKDTPPLPLEWFDDLVDKTSQAGANLKSISIRREGNFSYN